MNTAVENKKPNEENDDLAVGIKAIRACFRHFWHKK